jgi:VanZ family protein
MRRLVSHVVPVFAFAAWIFYLSDQPGVPAPEVPFLDKALHFAAYFVLAALLRRALLAYDLADGAAAGWAFWLSVFYGVTDELHQSFIPYREPSLFDLAADAVGAAAAVSLMAFRRNRQAVSRRQ